MPRQTMKRPRSPSPRAGTPAGRPHPAATRRPARHLSARDRALGEGSGRSPRRSARRSRERPRRYHRLPRRPRLAQPRAGGPVGRARRVLETAHVSRVTSSSVSSTSSRLSSLSTSNAPSRAPPTSDAPAAGILRGAAPHQLSQFTESMRLSAAVRIGVRRERRASVPATWRTTARVYRMALDAPPLR